MARSTVDASLPFGQNGEAIPVLAPGASAWITGLGAATSVAAALPTHKGIVRVAASADIYLAFGTSGVDAAQGTADTMYFSAGSEPFEVPAGATHVAALAVTGTGVAVSITSLE